MIDFLLICSSFVDALHCPMRIVNYSAEAQQQLISSNVADMVNTGGGAGGMGSAVGTAPCEYNIRPYAHVHDTGSCGYNRPCAYQHVGKSQSCMVENGRLYPHA